MLRPIRTLLSAALASALIAAPAGAAPVSESAAGLSTPTETFECHQARHALLVAQGLNINCSLLEQLALLEPEWAEFVRSKIALLDASHTTRLKVEPTIDFSLWPTAAPESIESGADSSSVQVDAASITSHRSSGPSSSVGVGRWRDLVSAYFAAADVERALRILACESLGDPSVINPSSGASGLFQHMPAYWAERSDGAGWDGADILDPEANVAVAAWMVYQMPGGGWGHWVCE